MPSIHSDQDEGRGDADEDYHDHYGYIALRWRINQVLSDTRRRIHGRCQVRIGKPSRHDVMDRQELRGA